MADFDSMFSRITEDLKRELERRIATGDKALILDAFGKLVKSWRNAEVSAANAEAANRAWKQWADQLKVHVLPLLRGELLKRLEAMRAKGFKGSFDDLMRGPR